METPTLRIYSWRGVAIGAQHYEGRLTIDGVEHKVKGPVTDALIESVSYDASKVRILKASQKRGIPFQSFVTKQDVRAAARAMLREMRPAVSTFVEHDDTVDRMTSRRVLPMRKHEGD